MLTIRTLASRLKLEILAGGDSLDREIAGGYACDLLSLVVSRIENDSIWLTVLNSINVIAVAALAECPCVLMTEGTKMDETVLERAEEQKLVVLSTTMTTFNAAASIDRILRGNCDDIPV